MVTIGGNFKCSYCVDWVKKTAFTNMILKLLGCVSQENFKVSISKRRVESSPHCFLLPWSQLSHGGYHCWYLWRWSSTLPPSRSPPPMPEELSHRNPTHSLSLSINIQLNTMFSSTGQLSRLFSEGEQERFGIERESKKEKKNKTNKETKILKSAGNRNLLFRSICVT